MDLCRCPNPTRDTSAPTRRLWCAHCGGATHHGPRRPLNATQATISQAQSILARLAGDIPLATEAVYGLQAANDTGSRPTGHSDPTSRISQDRRTDAATYLALSAKWIETALAMLINADEAAGAALYATDPHHGPPDHVKAPYHDTIPTGRPDLAEAHNARGRRRARGEL